MNLFGKSLPALPEPSGDRKQALRFFEKNSGLRFKSQGLLNQAFSHRSYSNENPLARENNERLEFLGDSVLGLIVSSYLFRTLPDRAEGDLAKIKSIVVSEDSLAPLAAKLGIDGLLLMGKGEDNSGGRFKKAILADALEAVIGAYYLDAGLESVQTFVLGLLIPEIHAVLENRHRKDYKTLLQELSQKKFHSTPRYNILAKEGPDHDRTYRMEVVVGGESRGQGQGKSKKEAEQAAAEQAYTSLSSTAPE